MAEPTRVLVVDDEEAILESLGEVLQDEGYDVVTARSAAAARKAAGEGVALALVDIKLGADNGIALLGELGKEHPALPVIMISGHGTVALTAEAFKLGAHDFMEKPLRLVKVRATVRNALETVRLKHQVSEQARTLYPQAVYRSDIMEQLYRQVRRLSAIGEPVVIMGPSGSGKELVAQALHYEGARADGPFVAANMASVPLNLAEDDLFGHEKGAFTGAHAARSGCLERADGGTLFLDEIADMAAPIQAKLLRVLETGQFTRLGGTKAVHVNVRIVAATHRDLERLVEEGTFRQDLWYRLCAFVLRTPALAERREDIAPLAETFLAKVCAEMNLERAFSGDALGRLSGADYPGNVRELKHIVTRAAVFAEQETIDRKIVEMVLGGRRSGGEAPADTTGAAPYASLDFRTARERFEKDYLGQALKHHGGNITATAAAIGMAQSNLSRKLKDLGLK